MFTERTSVGLDVHARSVAAAAIDGVTGELVERKLTPAHEHICSWLQDLPAPVAVAYEAGPTGFGLYRSLRAAGIRCEVAAPSKLVKPPGDRVKTDAKDAVHLARLLRLDEITPVAIPTPDQEAARDLVRAREDCRGDLMRARHRLSKLLLRRGIVYYGGRGWTGRHEQWLRQQRLDSPAVQRAFDEDFGTVLATQARRDRLDRAITAMDADSEYAALVHRPGCLRGIGTLTGFAVEIGDWHRFTGNSIGSFVGLVPSEFSSGASRSQGRITKTGNSHARRLLIEAACTIAAATGPAGRCGTGGNWHHRPFALAVTRATDGCMPGGCGSSNATRTPPWPTPPSPANSPAGAGLWPSWTTNPYACPAEHTGPLGGSAWSDPRPSYEQSIPSITVTGDARY